VDAEKNTRKLRRAAQRENGAQNKQRQRRKADAEAAEAHRDLTQPELSKGRPPAKDEETGKQRPSNAGTDGP
jgi:hypothetical protein